jgi:cell division GTPase FtsZ
MKLALIGFGQAGGKIVDKFLWYDSRTGNDIVRSAAAINTAKADLLGLEYVPESRRVLIGQSRVKGHGVGADNELGAEIAEQDIDEIQATIDAIPVHEIDAFLIVAALGGGTGSGGAPVLAKHLKRIYTEPVYGLGILPASNEGGIYTLNAARSFKDFVRESDNLFVFDNDSWRGSGESIESAYDEINEEIVQRFGVLFSAGEVSGDDAVGESVVDSSEIINTLACGGISTVGYDSESIERNTDTGGLLSRFTGVSDDGNGIQDSANKTNRVISLVRQATLGRLTLDCKVDGTERALVVVSGPPEYLNRKGIERARKWLEEQTGSMEVRGGDYPTPQDDQVAAVVLLSGSTDIPRIKQLQRVAIEAQENIESLREESDSNLQELVRDEDDELEPLF